MSALSKARSWQDVQNKLGSAQIIQPADLNGVLQVMSKPGDEPGQGKYRFSYLSFNEQHLVKPIVFGGNGNAL